jgi:hypothetical protein
MSLSESLAHVKKKRTIVSPNTGFMLQLLKYEEELKGLQGIGPVE